MLHGADGKGLYDQIHGLSWSMRKHVVVGINSMLRDCVIMLSKGYMSLFAQVKRRVPQTTASIEMDNTSGDVAIDDVSIKNPKLGNTHVGKRKKRFLENSRKKKKDVKDKLVSTRHKSSYEDIALI